MKSFSFLPDKNSKIKLYKQLYNRIVELIENSEIPVGEKLPSVRTLSINANIARNTVTKAYKELEENGYLHSIKKSGFYAKKPSSSTENFIKNKSDTINNKEKQNLHPKTNLYKIKTKGSKSDTIKSQNSQKKLKESKIPIILNSGYIIKDSKDDLKKLKVRTKHF